MMPWLGSPTSYASGYMSAHRTATDSQSFTCAFSSPPTYCTGFETRGSSGSRSGNTDGAVMLVQGSRVLGERAGAGQADPHPGGRGGHRHGHADRAGVERDGAARDDALHHPLGGCPDV